MAWEFQGNGGWVSCARARKGPLSGPCRRLPRAASAAWAPGLGAPGTLLFSSLGLLHLCSHPFRRSMRVGPQRPCVPQGAFCLWHCPRGGVREGEGYMDSAPAPGVSRGACAEPLGPSCPSSSVDKPGQAGAGQGCLWAHSDLWPPEAGGHSASRGVVGGGKGELGQAHTTQPPPRLCGPLSLSVHSCETGMQRQADIALQTGPALGQGFILCVSCPPRLGVSKC